MTEDRMFTTKTYLVKIKVGMDFKDEDLLMAIGHKGGDNIDIEDMKNIVTVLNKVGLWTPILSEAGTNWKSIKNSADLKALGQIGTPLLLLEEVLTFRQILDFAYKNDILNAPKGLEILATKNEERNPRRKSNVSITFQQATNHDNPMSLSNMVSRTMNNSRMVAGLSNGASPLHLNGTAPETQKDQAQHTHPGTFHNKNTGNDIGATNAEENSPTDQVGAEVEILSDFKDGETHEGGGFDPKKFNVDAIDNELEQLEDPSLSDLEAKTARYKVITKTLRDSLSYACLTVQRLVKTVDAKELQLRELNSFASARILDGIKPELAKVGQLGQIKDALQALDAKVTSELASVHTGIKNLGDQVAHNASLVDEHSNNVVRHLNKFGITSDIPNAVSNIYRIINEEIAPEFRAKHSVVQNQTP